MSKARNNLIGHTIFLTSEKYRMLPVIGHTMFFTSEKSNIGFPAFRRGFPKWECSQLSLLPLNRSWFQGLQTLFQSNNLSKTQQKNESSLMEEIPPKELNAYISEFIITVRKKLGQQRRLRTQLLTFFDGQKNSTFLSKALINRQPSPLQKLR